MIAQAHAQERPVVDVTVETDIYFYALEIMDGRLPVEVDNFEGLHTQRDVVEFILVQKAMALGGLDVEFNITHGNYDARNPKLLARGLLLISFDTIWMSEASLIKDNVYISDAMVRKGEFWAGVYTSPDNQSALGIRSIKEFQKHTVVSSTAWRTDWMTLQAMKPLDLIDESDWISMAKMVSNQWIDLMLIPFTAKRPFEYRGHDYRVVAIEGVKIKLDDSRHFLVSKKHPLGRETFDALQKGLKILRANGTIERAYHDSGFINDLVADWIILNE
ncbi:hypothetical protein HR060_09045 [Catenovulum sp. SM1970]|nr:hypothetical protein [Marinifaba aquimaris]